MRVRNVGGEIGFFVWGNVRVFVGSGRNGCYDQWYRPARGFITSVFEGLRAVVVDNKAGGFWSGKGKACGARGSGEGTEEVRPCVGLLFCVALYICWIGELAKGLV